MAPEQARGEWDRIDQRADIFGLGALLYKLLTDHTPHEGASVSEVLDRAKKGDITSPRQLDPTIPVQIETVCIAEALAAAPENRYTTAREFAAALQEAIGPAPIVVLTPRSAWLDRRLLAAIVACGVFALAVWFWPRNTRTTSSVAPPVVAKPAGGPLTAEIDVTHYKESGDGKVGPADQRAVSAVALVGDPPRFNDMVRVHVALSRPAHGYLIAFNPNGKDQFCIPINTLESESSRQELDYPEDERYYFHLNDGIGLQAFVVVISDQPLPGYETWKTQVPGGLTWSTMDCDGFWSYDSSKKSGVEGLSGNLRGEIIRRESAPKGLVNLCDQLRRSPGVTLVRAVAFPVKPDVEIVK